MRFFVFLAVLFSTLQGAGAEPLRIVSAGPAGIEAFEQVRREIPPVGKLDIKLETFKRSAAVHSLAANHIDGLIVAMSPADMFREPEKNDVPRVNFGEYQFLQFARTKVDFFLHPENPIKSLNTEQVANLLSGKDKSWKDISNWPKEVKTIGIKNLQSTTKATCKHYLKETPCHFDEFVIDPAGALRALQKNPGAIVFMGGEPKIPNFHPKIFPSTVDLPMFLLIKRSGRPEILKLFQILKDKGIIQIQ